MRRTLATVLVLLALAAPTADAVRLEGEIVILPVIGRFPGDGGTQWRTDVFLYNPYSDPATITLRFYDAAGLHQHSVALDGYRTLTFPDIVLSTFGATNAGGPLELHSTSRIEARARIYNTGNPAGQFGQSVPGIAKTLLSRQASIYGLSGAGSRVNIGVMNPHDHPVSVALRIADRNNATLHAQALDVPPHSYRQLSNIFTLFSIPEQDGVHVSFDEFDDPIYGYASVVRNDTGDAVFLFGTAPNTGP